MQAERSVQEDMIITAREQCDSFRNCLAGAIVWISLFIPAIVVIIVTVIVTQVVHPSESPSPDTLSGIRLPDVSWN